MIFTALRSECFLALLLWSGFLFLKQRILGAATCGFSTERERKSVRSEIADDALYYFSITDFASAIKLNLRYSFWCSKSNVHINFRLLPPFRLWTFSWNERIFARSLVRNCAAIITVLEGQKRGRNEVSKKHKRMIVLFRVALRHRSVTSTEGSLSHFSLPENNRKTEQPKSRVKLSDFVRLSINKI